MKSPHEVAPGDLRMPALAAAAWTGALGGGLGLGPVLAMALAAVIFVGGLAVWQHRRRPRLVLLAVGMGVVFLGTLHVTAARAHQVTHNPLAGLAQHRAAAHVVGTVISDPRRVTSGRQDAVVWRIRALEVERDGRTVALSTPLLVMTDVETRPPPLGARVRVDVRLAPASGGELSAFGRARAAPDVIAPPSVWWRGSAAVRESIRDSVRGRPIEQRALVPALVDGDDSQLPESLATQFRETGLTHLLAVSGTNLTLMVGFVVGMARWCRIRGRWLAVVGACGIVGFILLARTEPSVLRAAVMGAIGLIGMSPSGRQRGPRILAVAVVVLLLVDPALATSAGFVLSVLATAGILVLAPGMRDAMCRWLPRWVAEAIAVPLAAQLACTPVVAAISGQVSLVAVVANVAAAPAVGPATVLGLAGGLVGLLSPAAGAIFGTLAAWCVGWIVTVAERGAALPTAAIGWSSGATALLLLTVLVVLIAWLSPLLLSHPLTGVGCCLVMVACVVVSPRDLGWPPAGWLAVACDVGQGDALAVRVGPGSAIVVDTGPDPLSVDRCLDRLGVKHVPLLVLTHFHADHIAGLSGVLSNRRVDRIESTTTLDPPDGVEEVIDTASKTSLTPTFARYGATRILGSVTVQTLWPAREAPTRGSGDGSAANDASVVLLVETVGIRLLLTGDIEPISQGKLAHDLSGLSVDVLKMPHHGSSHQNLPWLRSLDAEVVLVSVGADNDYGHPSNAALTALKEVGADVFRTDLRGDLAVVVRDGAPQVLARGR